jgi:hypothetical protein
VTPEEEAAHEDFVQRYNEEQDVKEDVSAAGVMAAILLLPALAFYAVLDAIFGLPGWTFVLFGLPVFLGPRLFALWRFNTSSLPLKVHGLATFGREKRNWLIIAGVVFVAGVLVKLLGPMVLARAGGW